MLPHVSCPVVRRSWESPGIIAVRKPMFHARMPVSEAHHIRGESRFARGRSLAFARGMSREIGENRGSLVACCRQSVRVPWARSCTWRSGRPSQRSPHCPTMCVLCAVKTASSCCRIPAAQAARVGRAGADGWTPSFRAAVQHGSSARCHVSRQVVVRQCLPRSCVVLAQIQRMVLL